jgi:hypothetical protein
MGCAWRGSASRTWSGHPACVTGSARVRYRTGAADTIRRQRLSPRAGDIISTPVKSGTTWIQMTCALLDDDGQRRYAARVKQLAPPDLIEWLHREPTSDIPWR